MYEAIQFFNKTQGDNQAFANAYQACATLEEKKALMQTAFDSYFADHGIKAIYPGAANFLVGKHGKVPAGVDPDLQQRALDQLGLKKPIDPVSSLDKEDALPGAAEQLRKRGIKWPSIRRRISTAMGTKSPQDKDAVDHAVKCEKCNNVPQNKPELPFYAQSSDMDRYTKNGVMLRDTRDITESLGGVAALHTLARSIEYLRKQDDGNAPAPIQLPDTLVEFGDLGSVKSADEIFAWMASIQQKLKTHGFTDGQTHRITADFFEADKISMVDKTLRDIFDSRSEGLYDYALARAADYNAANDMTFAASHLAAEEAVA